MLFVLKHLIYYINEKDFEKNLINDIIEKMLVDNNKNPSTLEQKNKVNHI